MCFCREVIQPRHICWGFTKQVLLSVTANDHSIQESDLFQANLDLLLKFQGQAHFFSILQYEINGEFGSVRHNQVESKGKIIYFFLKHV